MSTGELVDYLVNNDLEIQIIRGDIEAIQAQLKSEGYNYSDEALVAALKQIRRSDPYIKRIAVNLG